jgi:hypothetical protein
MYNADDAIARVDSYIVSVSGGAPFVGERKLVRIERVERAAAVASLPEAEESGNGQLESSGSGGRRRRGRRGGRRRSRAKSGSTTNDE